MRVAVIGGGMSGLSAAHEASKFSDEITLFHQKPFSSERSGCWGQAIKDFSRVPLDKDADGYLRDLQKVKFEDRRGSAEVSFTDGAAVERSSLESEWASQLKEVSMEQERVDKSRLKQISEKSDLVVDCSGPFPVSKKIRNFRYRLIAPMLNCKVSGDFSDIYPNVKVIRYKNYFLEMMPETEEECNIAIGCSKENNPAEMYTDMKDMLSGRDIEVPAFGEMKHGNYVSNTLPTILRHSSFGLNGAEVRLTGDALGIASDMSGFGNSRAAWTGIQAVRTYFNNESYRRKILSDQLLSRSVHTIFRPLHRRIGIVRTMKYIGGQKVEADKLGDPRNLKDIIKASKQVIKSISKHK